VDPPGTTDGSMAEGGTRWHRPLRLNAWEHKNCFVPILFFAILTFIFVTAYLLEEHYNIIRRTSPFLSSRHMTEHQTPGPTMRQTDALTTYQRHTQIARPHKIMHRIFILIVMRIRVTRFSVKRIKSVF
jgi:hypothetical protein